MATFATFPANTLIDPVPFKLGIHDTAIEELQTLLKITKLAKPTYENTTKDANYGVSRDWLEEAVRFWREDFDWRKHEKEINAYPQYTMLLAAPGQKSYRIHFAALFSQKRDAVPIIMFHGWPGSFLEFLPVLTHLQKEYTPETLPHHVIVPSLPGFAFSDPPPLECDFNLGNVAAIMDQLMVNLGFGDGYVAQGGDLGSKVARILGSRYQGCKAVHVNYCYLPEPENVKGEISEVDRRDIARAQNFKETGSGYALEQATRPATLGIVLSSSPLALLAWVGEKFLEWSDESPSLDTIIEAVALYWFTDTISSSFYNYRQPYVSENAGGHANKEYYIKKPFGYSSFAMEITPVPKAWVAETGELVFYRRHDKGGHFAALEKPEVLWNDLKDFIEQVWVA
ncbi:alpha/beta-Hydrolase [Glarea lozoyensis ATCC 20868]|uniref:Alpha/beta-Hydrolase n=1 Tax=Glarea lozoyensis (strain ATCC 20868 / MF5171) TaxID=1116229 RepID=S3DHA2_GLAL2|nr:alpha/beta-Hydrolase [Glarea lozoyensis ATCC 20868]EPE36539.1 alpha/beta-Hydrolase [Glarea lozoyensis ATCC 20868]